MKNRRDPATPLRLQAKYNIVGHSADHVELRSGVWNKEAHQLVDESASGMLLQVVMALRQPMSAAALAEAQPLPIEEAQAILDHLDGLGVLEDKPQHALDAYLQEDVAALSQGLPQQSAQRIVLLGDAELCAAIAQLLQSSHSGLSVEMPVLAPEAAAALNDPNPRWLLDGLQFAKRSLLFAQFKDAFVVHADRLVHPVKLQILNRMALAHGFSWMNAAHDGPFLFVGPTFEPHRGACFECFEQRVLMNLKEAASYVAYKNALANKGVALQQQPLLAALTGVVASHTALEAVNYVSTGANFTTRRLLSIYLPTMEFAFSDVLQVPACAACGVLPVRDSKELYFSVRGILDAARAVKEEAPCA